MKLEHYYVNLIDLPEVLPFTITPDEEADLSEAVAAQEKSSKALFTFIEALEDFDTIHYIGQDNVEGKFYQRFLFEGGGFLEIMQKAPCAVIAHFSSEDRAEKFLEILHDIILDTARDEAAAKLLVSDLEVAEETEGALSYEQWSKMENVRETVTD